MRAVSKQVGQCAGSHSGTKVHDKEPAVVKTKVTLTMAGDLEHTLVMISLLLLLFVEHHILLV